MLHQNINTFAQVVAFYADPLPHESRGRGYMAVICEAKLAALRSVMGEDQIVRMPARAITTKLATKAKATKRMGAEAFFDAFQTARRNVSAVIGDRWVTLGYAQWATVPVGMRSFKGPKGSKISLPKDIRCPPAQYWPGGRIPEGLTMAATTAPLRDAWVMFTQDEGKPYMMHPLMKLAFDAHMAENAAPRAFVAE